MQERSRIEIVRSFIGCPFWTRYAFFPISAIRRQGQKFLPSKRSVSVLDLVLWEEELKFQPNDRIRFG